MDATGAAGTTPTTNETGAATPTQAQATPAASRISRGWLIGGILFWALGGFYGAYLSWSCNSNHGFGVLSKMFFAFFSLLGGWGYVLNYLIFKSYTCDPVASLMANPEAAARFLQGHSTLR